MHFNKLLMLISFFHYLYRGVIECKEPIEVVSYKIGVCKVSPKGKDCSTTFEKLGFNGTTSVVLCKPHTGRMHQIRVHLQYLGKWHRPSNSKYHLYLAANFLIKNLSSRHFSNFKFFYYFATKWMMDNNNQMRWKRKRKTCCHVYNSQINYVGH